MPKQSYRVCFCFRRGFKLAATEAPEEVKAFFNRYSDNGVMTIDHLHRFLVEVQQQRTASREDAQHIMDTAHGARHPNIFPKKGFNLEAFFNYLFGDSNPPLSPSAGALQRGVRVIELDIWPSSSKDDVDVLHGRTLTTPVKLIKCLRSIKEHAFSASEYPVVITLEDHLTAELQAKVAEMVTQTFGDMLFCPGPEALKEFPSPEFLKKRFIISTKPPKEYLKDKELKEKENGSSRRTNATVEEAWGTEIPDIRASDVTDDKNDLDEEDDEEDSDEKDPKLQQQEAASEYKRLIAIHAGKVKGGLTEWLAVDPDKVSRLSLSEQELEKAAKTHGKDIIRFTQQNVLRVYPKGTRFNSSNYNPLIGWMHGAQMVAFNMQGYGRSLWLMQGMFKANGGCGCVKKPDFLLNTGPNGEIFDPRAKLAKKTTLKVIVYMGEGWYFDFSHTHFDQYSPPDFYVRVGIAGMPVDSIMKKTRVMEDNWVPDWNEGFEFPLTVPELALLRIEVHEYDMSEKDDFAGQTCLPVSELRSGVRMVPLYRRNGDKLKSAKLLMRFEFL